LGSFDSFLVDSRDCSFGSFLGNCYSLDWVDYSMCSDLADWDIGYSYCPYFPGFDIPAHSLVFGCYSFAVVVASVVFVG
jgi:hypothetical protein